MARDLSGKKIKMPSRPEVIHGKAVKVGKGVGQKIGQQAKSAMQLKREAEQELLKG